MLPINSMTIAKDILVQSLLSVAGLPPVPQQNIKSRPKVLAKVKSSVSMIKSVMSSGRDNSSKPRATKPRQISSTKTIWALFLWRRMVMSPVLNGPNISSKILLRSSFPQFRRTWSTILSYRIHVGRRPYQTFTRCQVSPHAFFLDDHDITDIPELSKKHFSSFSPKHNQPFVPLDEPTDNPTKKRSLRPTPSSRGCVETKSHGTKVPCSSRAYGYAQKNVKWKDSLFPRQHPTSSPSPSTAK